MGLILVFVSGLLTAVAIARWVRRVRSRPGASPRQARAMLLIVGVLLILPALAMINCGGWNEGSGKVTSCLIDSPFLREFSESLYGLLLLSAFTLGLPIFVYLLLIGLLAKFVTRRLK
jgi:hypothetical protein